MTLLFQLSVCSFNNLSYHIRIWEKSYHTPTDNISYLINNFDFTNHKNILSNTIKT